MGWRFKLELLLALGAYMWLRATWLGKLVNAPGPSEPKTPQGSSSSVPTDESVTLTQATALASYTADSDGSAATLWLCTWSKVAGGSDPDPYWFTPDTNKMSTRIGQDYKTIHDAVEASGIDRGQDASSIVDTSVYKAT